MIVLDPRTKRHQQSDIMATVSQSDCIIQRHGLIIFQW